jgi:propanediol utilization protein
MQNRQHELTAVARVRVALSVRHVHLTQGSVERLFGAGHVLRVATPLWQPGQYAAEETVTLQGPHGSIPHVRIVGPPRGEDQVEVSGSDERMLGLHAPLRVSGRLEDTPGITLLGPEGALTLDHGVVRPLRHLHLSPVDAEVLDLRNGQWVSVAVTSGERRMIFDDVAVRVAPDARLEVHLDTDEGNAAGLCTGDEVSLMVIDGER